jgi:hypothetical protein
LWGIRNNSRHGSGIDYTALPLLKHDLAELTATKVNCV